MGVRAGDQDPVRGDAGLLDDPPAGGIAADAARADVVDDYDRQPRGAAVEHEATRPQFVVNTGTYAWSFSLQVGFELNEVKHQVLARDRFCVAEPNRDFR